MNPVKRLTVLFLLVCIAGFLAACSKPPVDPVDQVRVLIPKLVDALNKRDLAALKKLGTDKFEPNRFVTDVFAHGVQGEVTLSMTRFRQVPGENKLGLSAIFGADQSGGIKDLTLFLVGEKVLKIDTYTLKDITPPHPGTVGGATTQGQ
jgi:hypothetical protein